MAIISVVTLQAGLNTLRSLVAEPSGYNIVDFIENLQTRSVPLADQTLVTGGTRHNKTGHQAVSDRTVQLGLNNWKMAAGTVIGNVVSETLPYVTASSNVQKIIWPANSQIKIQQEWIVPSDYDTAADAQAIKLLTRLTESTVVSMDAAMFIVKGGAAIGGDINPGTKILSINGTLVEEISLSVTHATFAKDDIVSTQLFPIGNVTAVTVELWGSFIQYTAEE